MKSYRNLFTSGARVPIRDVRYAQSDCGNDGFKLRVDAAGNCRIDYSNGRGKRYALREVEAVQGAAFVGRAEDFADFSRRGIVEGYYGKPYTDEDRKSLLDFMDAVRMNFYLYAPKDDPYHRAQWREPYPQAKQAELAALCRYASEREIDLCYAISVGLDMRYSSEDDLCALVAKLKAMEAVGFREFALLFDDIDPALNPADAAMFESPAKAQAATVEQVQKALGKSVLFCPTDYWQNDDTPYRAGIKAHLPTDTTVMWTGYNTVAEYIDKEDAARARQYFGHDLMLWDNYPVSDFMTERLFLGALRNRDADLYRTHSGMVMNPMEYPELSKFALYTAAQYMWNAATYDPDRAQSEAAAVLVPNAPAAALRLIEDNAACVMYDPPLHGDPIERERVYRKLRAALNPRLLDELKDYFNYATLECRAYRALQAGKDISNLLSKLRAAKIRTAPNRFDTLMSQTTSDYKPKQTREKYRVI